VTGTPGRQTVRFDRASAPRAGTYVVRLTQGVTRATAKVALLQ